ncbi:MAG: hypothetical protein KDA66_18730 [Planctomycetaceae bacterium]|nr:hypothetical protein [Planctomycetaceae bacterium]
MNNTEILTELKSRLRTVVASNFGELAQQFDDVCGYAICAPPYFEHIFPAFQVSSALQDSPAEFLGLKTYFPPEWDAFGTVLFDDEFNAIVSEISSRRCNNESLDYNVVFDAILDVLIELESEGVFGPRSSGRFVTVCDIEGDESLILSASEKLNSADVHAAVLRTFGRA